MMRTPSKRRSFADHQAYYKTVAPKIETRWEKGTPLIRRRKSINKPANRRSSDSDLLNLPPPLTLPSSSPKIDEEYSAEAFAAAPSISINGELVVNHSGSDGMQSHSVSMDISSHLEDVGFHFKGLFSQLEAYLKTKSSDVEKKFVEKQMKDLKEHANQIEFMISDLTARASRLESFLTGRLADSESDAEWKL